MGLFDKYQTYEINDKNCTWERFKEFVNKNWHDYGVQQTKKEFLKDCRPKLRREEMCFVFKSKEYLNNNAF